VGKGASEIGKEFGQIEVGKPGIDNHGFGRRGLGLGPCLRAALRFANLPTQAGENVREPLAEVAIGAGYKGGAGSGAGI
jgi:hypothetical protein